MNPMARRMFELVEPIGVLPYAADEPNETMFALGFTNYWDTYFAGRAAPLGTSVPAEVVHALLYNVGPGEVARHIPKVWRTTTPQAALATRQQGCVTVLNRILGDLVTTRDFLRAGDLGMRARSFGRIHHHPDALLTELIDGLRTRGLIEDELIAALEPLARQLAAA